jgi:hypothetical protein
LRNPTPAVHPRVARPCPAVEPLEGRCLLSATPSGLLQNVPSASVYKLVYDLDIPKLGGDFSKNAVPYSVNNAATAGSFYRMAYYLELKNAAGQTKWIWVSAKAVTTDAKKLGVPTVASGAFFQQKLENMEVRSNVPGVVTGTGLGGGNIEFWPNSYAADNAANVLGASNTSFDFGDKVTSGPAGYGSMQIHNAAAKQTLLAYNAWGGTTPTVPAEIGIGNNPTGEKDWTYNHSADQWTARRLQVLVRPETGTTPTPTPTTPTPTTPTPTPTTPTPTTPTPTTPTPTTPTPTKSIGSILPLGDSITYGYSDKAVLSAGYRSRLYTDLVNAGRSFQYVGSMKEDKSAMLKAAGEGFHEGHGGFRTDQILGNLTGVVDGTDVSSNNGGHWLDGTGSRPAVNPNIILLHVGTNDFLQRKSVAYAAGNLDQIVAKLTSLRPNAKLFVSNIIPMADATQNASVIAYNKQIKDVIVPKYKALGKKVYFVDQYKNFVDAAGKVVTSAFPDKVHPTRAGYDKIGDTWSKAILAATNTATTAVAVKAASATSAPPSKLTTPGAATFLASPTKVL